MRIIWDAAILTMYPLGGPGFRGGTETMIERICHGLAERGHTVHLVTRDLEREEQRGPTEFWWPQAYHPREADVVVMTQQLTIPTEYEADTLVLAHTGCDPYLGPENQWAEGVDCWPVFSETHKAMLLEQRPAIAPERVYVTGLGVDVEDYDLPLAGVQFYDTFATFTLAEAKTQANDPYGPLKIPGRMFYANDPMRGLFYTLDVFDLVRKQVPEASLHVAYDFDRQFSVHQWEHTYKAQLSWNMKRRLETTPGVVNLGALSRADLVREQLECQVHCMPSDPPNIGTQTWGITQMECAAAGAALVLSDVEAFPEVFGEAATILPVIGYFSGEHERRIGAEDYAAAVVELMQDQARWQEASRKARALAEQHTWDRVIDRWEAMLTRVKEKAA